jgi:hypothetical protein
MGLTIHYGLKSNTRSLKKARELVAHLRGRAMDLPFAQVDDIIEIGGEVPDFDRRGQDDPHGWLLIQAGQYIERTAADGREHCYRVAPTHVIAFGTLPGEGCEQANWGLCRYPAFIEVTDSNLPHRTKRLRTCLSGWRWSSFCKTQYASNPECGGVENFLRCHLAIVKMLDHAKTLGILEEVCDEGDFWKDRDVRALARQVGEWNEMTASFAGELTDLLGDQVEVEAAITKFPNFEHLEAAGRGKE